jgi:hypothetical protein
VVGVEVDASVMTSLLTQHWAIAAPYGALIGIVVGGLIGFVHFRTFKRNTYLYLKGRFGVALAANVARFALLGCAMVFLAKLGAVALISGTVSLTIVRSLILRRERRAQ